MEIKRKRLIVGLTGPICGGKGIVAEYLRKKGFFYTSTSEQVREECRRRKITITRENLQKLGDEMRKKFGSEVWAKRCWEMINKKKVPLTIVDSIRGEAEVDFLKTKSNFARNKVLAKRGSYLKNKVLAKRGSYLKNKVLAKRGSYFYLIGVIAPRRTRFKRVMARGRESDPMNWNDFLRIDKADFKSGKGKFGRDITACLRKSDLLLNNNGTVKQLEKKVNEWFVNKFKESYV